MQPILTTLNAIAAVYGTYLLCRGNWIAGTALLVVPLISVMALSVQRMTLVKRVGWVFNGGLVLLGLGYTIFALNRVAGLSAEQGGGGLGVMRELWLSLWLLVLPAVTGWRLWAQEKGRMTARSSLG